jgi:hypothetical protein
MFAPEKLTGSLKTQWSRRALPIRSRTLNPVRSSRTSLLREGAAFHDPAGSRVVRCPSRFFLRRSLLLLGFFHIIALAFSADGKTALEFRLEIEL